MPRDRPSLPGIVFRTLRRFLPSPGRVIRGVFSPRRFFRRFRLRWVVLFAVACVVWLVAALTEPAPQVAFGSTPDDPPATDGERPDPTRVERSVASSPEAASRFFRKLVAAVQAGARTGHVELSITEVEATSALDAGAQLAEIRQIMSTLTPEQLEELDSPEEIRRVMDARSGGAPDGALGRVRHALSPRFRLRQAQVRFRPDGRVLVSGYAHAWSRRVPVYLDAVPALEEGRVSLDVRETRVGRLRVPSWVLGGPSKLLTLVLGLGRDYARLEALRVGDGRLSVSGRVEVPRGR